MKKFFKIYCFGIVLFASVLLVNEMYANEAIIDGQELNCKKSVGDDSGDIPPITDGRKCHTAGNVCRCG